MYMRRAIVEDSIQGEQIMKEKSRVMIALLWIMIQTITVCASDEEWICPNCGAVATMNFCSECGEMNPNRRGNTDYLETTFSSSDAEKIGDAKVKLKKGFDFVNTNSSQINYDLALTAVTLSAQAYTNASGDHSEIILKKLGYESTFPFHFGISNFKSPVAYFGYKQLDKGKNLFTVVVRGTESDLDILTDVIDGAFSMFSESGDNVREALIKFMEEATGKSGDAIKDEENYFFFTGHSLGGAIANYLSIENTIMEYAHFDKEKIYTYTFESPHTCINLLFMNPKSMSNAFNFKVEGDVVTDLPFYMGSTTYGEDKIIKVDELSDSTYKLLFPNSIEGIDEIGLHDTCLGLIYLIDEGKINISSEESNDEYDEQTNYEYDGQDDYNEDGMNQESANISDFSIEGKWKNIGTGTFGQIQKNAIVIFDGKYCNVYSPADTYAFYMDGDSYKLDCTSMLFAETLSFYVKVVDNNHINLYYGSSCVELRRVD